MPPKIVPSQLYHEIACHLGEGPFWWDESLWWVDIEAGELHRFDHRRNERISHAFGCPPGVAVPADDGRILVALGHEIGIFSHLTRELAMIAPVQPGFPHNRFNDGKCDPRGRFVVGSLHQDEIENAAELYLLEDGNYRRILAPVTISNGLAWSADGKTLYYIDTPTLQVAAFEYDLDRGALGEGRVAVTIPAEAGYPDGMCVDDCGNLWVAHWDGGAVRCWSPEDGHCLAMVDIPCSRPTSCCFGGPDRDLLFITTARNGLTEQELATQPLAGSVFVARPEVTGPSPVAWKADAHF